MMKKTSKKDGNEQAFLKQIQEKVPKYTKIDNTIPNVTYEIDHVHGYSGDRNKNVLFFGRDNSEIIFTTAALVVM